MEARKKGIEEMIYAITKPISTYNHPTSEHIF